MTQEEFDEKKKFLNQK
ncbi:hypothetical protein [Flavobacterium sp. 83]